MDEKKKKKKLTLTASSSKPHSVQHYTQSKGKTSVVIEKKPPRRWSEKKFQPKENFNNHDLIKDKYDGIRPAPGYAACPDHSEKDKIWKILSVEENTGISLTETRAMYPAASVCGWYFSHPKAKYFNLGDKW